MADAPFPAGPDKPEIRPAAVSHLRAESSKPMQRSMSDYIREEREQLREVAEQTLNVIVDLNLDGTIKWVSPSWAEVIGTQPEVVQGQPLSDIIVSDNKGVFSEVVESMKKDDTKSHRVRFAVALGPLSKLLSLDNVEDGAENAEPQVTDLEAQGIMVYDGTSGGESHTMWMIRPWTAPREVQIDLPNVIVDSLGSGAEVLASYLTQLAESGVDPELHPPPPPALCRICERQIPPWWFEKHTDLCLQEHRAEVDVQMAQEGLTDHRHSIVKVLDALEVRRSRTLTGDLSSLTATAEYKGLPIGPSPSGQSSPSSSSATSRERTGFGHARGRSFAVRRPQARIVELLVDLCDTAIEISTPAIKEPSSHAPGELRTQSPQSESRISQVMQWQSPSSNTLEQEQGLALLCADTERVAKSKVEAVFRHRRIMEYAERIRVEFALLVQDCIDEALRKAARIASGRLSDSAEDDEEEGEEGEDDYQPGQDESFYESSFHDPDALAEALHNVSISEDPSRARPTSFIESVQSQSPHECPTPTSNMGGLNIAPLARDSQRDSRRDSLRNSRREPLILGSEAGESEGSIRSSSAASRNPPRTDSPISEFGDLRRAASSRRHHRRSLILPGTASPRRQESPSRSNQPPSSPLRAHKPKGFPFPQDSFGSPESSPMLPSGEFSSPAAMPPPPTLHHRRQSSAAMSEFVMRAPPSPRLGGHNAPPQARPTQPSIKDFEIIKPISKGAFGSVYLSKKKSTGEYFAIKVLKKADMVAKNQVGNVKAERAIMMWQGQSDFVAKLYWTFSSKEYLYLVMEYLNGGDCASLIKVLGGLQEDWAKKYLGEVILGVEHLHSRDIIHRDLKPDNLLIDQRGHLKLTDFGLSRMGLVGRQQRALKSDNESAPDLLKQGPFARSVSVTSSRSTSLDFHGNHSPSLTPIIPPDLGNAFSQPSYFSLGPPPQDSRKMLSHRSDSGGSETLPQMMTAFSLNDSEAGSQPQSAKSHADEFSEVASQDSPDLSGLQSLSQQGGEVYGKNTPPQSSMMPPPMALFDPEDTNRRFVGTPDYLAPETIKGEKQNETSDWWSVGCIMFEFLYGIPPFHDTEAELVFENILARRIRWPENVECEPVSDEAKDLINKLLCTDPNERLGANMEGKFASGGEEIRNHPWFREVSWDTLLEDEAQFVPQTEDPEDTEYFDARGATLQSFAEEMEDQSSPPSSAAGSDYPDRPHDALSRVRSQVNSIKRGLMPLHIPPHVRDLKSRRLSEPVPADDFGNFSFKNLPVLEKANKDVIQKLRAEALAAQNKQMAMASGGQSVISPGASLEGSPVMLMPVQRTLSNAKASARPQSPSGLSHSNSSPNRMSQPSSPLLVSFVAGQGSDGRRKVSSNSSNLSQQSGLSLPPFEPPRMPPSLQKAATVAASSPIKPRGSAPPPLALSPQKSLSTPRQASRSRSLTVGSQSHEGSPVAPDALTQRHNRRSQVFDMSPSSSDNEGEKHNARLRVQRRRQSSRRLSQIALEGTLVFRPLDVLICEDHPVSRMVMEKLLEKVRCRTISVPNGSEAVRYSTSEIKFDIIFLEYKLPHINGADVARMIRETKNANSHTPIVAITAYLKELQAPHYFDSLIEKPISSSKLTDVLRTLCQWKPATPQQSASLSIPRPMTSTLRQSSLQLEDSPTSGSSVFAGRLSSSLISSSREQSIGSSLYGDSESISTDDVPLVISRKPTGEWEEGGLGIREGDIQVPVGDSFKPGSLSVPGQFDAEKQKARRDSRKSSDGSTESADDEDEELGLGREKHLRNKPVLPSSKLGIEMMRANSHDSILGSEGTLEPTTQVVTPSTEPEAPILSSHEPRQAQTPPDCGSSGLGISTEETPRARQGVDEEEPTPRPTIKTS
ncbi:related to RIM15 - protein kinase involved in expression of meiotic genes [Cephalotrichum gorgonifer]|uniref:non-specific serine/threonine protein kinase n=1 Tax=Cephalotrichum gorgonifer TaxID=2041049 RepID=A0AAE8MQP3_9PEZI|nr:related to RIM15 - protein kinase involved in expression of meiotic genes [Cephalotrichum gorgonifer]